MVACRYACINENVKRKDVVKREQVTVFRDHCGIHVAVKAILPFSQLSVSQGHGGIVLLATEL